MPHVAGALPSWPHPVPVGNVQVISTCRPGARIATTGKMSKHASGQAIDFRVPGRKAEVVAWLRQNHNAGGTMTYSDMDHIHVDVGARFVALSTARAAAAAKPKLLKLLMIPQRRGPSHGRSPYFPGRFASCADFDVDIHMIGFVAAAILEMGLQVAWG